MKKLGKLQDDLWSYLFCQSTQSPLLQDLEECQQQILGADYSKVLDIDTLIECSIHLPQV